MTPIHFFVPGDPKALKRHRDYALKNGMRIHMDPSESDKSDFLAKAMQFRPDVPAEGPLFLDLIFVFPRPKCHYRTGRHAALLRDDAPFWHAKKPDRDNLEKLVLDALNKIFWTDDCNICCGSVRKIYGNRPGVYLSMREVSVGDLSHLAAISDVMATGGF